jgi:hypothetical protein
MYVRVLNIIGMRDAILIKYRRRRTMRKSRNMLRNQLRQEDRKMSDVIRLFTADVEDTQWREMVVSDLPVEYLDADCERLTDHKDIPTYRLQIKHW